MAKCRSCDATMVWARVADSDRMIPLDTRPVVDGNVVLLGTQDPDGVRLVRVLGRDEQVSASTKRFRSHFVSCPNAAEHRAKDRERARVAGRRRGIFT